MVADDLQHNRADFAFRGAVNDIGIVLALVEQGLFVRIRISIIISELVAFFVLDLFIIQTRIGTHRLVFEVGRDRKHVQPVDPEKLFLLGQRGTGHASQFFVHAEVVLDGDGGVRDVFRLDFHAFLGFHGLVKSVRPAPSGHHAPGKLIHDDDFAILDDVFLVAAEEEPCPQRLLQEAHQAGLLGLDIFRSFGV